MRNLILALALVVGCGGAEAAHEGSAINVAVAPVGNWTCSLDGATLGLSSAGAYSLPVGGGGYAVEGKQIAFSNGLDGFCQLTGSVFAFTVASSTPDLAGAVLWLSAPGQVTALNHSP